MSHSLLVLIQSYTLFVWLFATLCCKDILKMAVDPMDKDQKGNIMAVVHDLYYPPDII